MQQWTRAQRRGIGSWLAGAAIGWSALVAPDAQAAGTAAGTAIPNTAVLSYAQAGVTRTVAAAAAPVIVARVLGVTVTWQDATPTPAASPDTQRPLAFVVTNTGNAPDTFRLSRDNALAGDQFDPADATPTAIWLENGLQPGPQFSGAAADQPYVPGGNDITLAADASRVVYLASSIPAGNATGALGRAALQAQSTAAPAGSVPGTQVGFAGLVPVVVGPKGAQASAPGSYLVASVAIGIAKSVVAVRDPAGGTSVGAGSVVTYRLLVTAAGSGTANGVTVTDPLPAALTYVPGSLTVDGAARTDAADGDDASVSSGTVRIQFPSISAPASRAIEFKATVN